MQSGIFLGKVIERGLLFILCQHPEGRGHRDSKPEVILDHDAAKKGADELEALHPLRVGHLGVHGIAVTLCTGAVPSIGCPDEQWQLIAH